MGGGRHRVARGRPWPWPWCGGWWMHQALKRGSNVTRRSGEGFQTIYNFPEKCRRGEVRSILVDSQTLMFCLEFKGVIFDAAKAEDALRRFLSHFENVQLIFAFPEPGPNDGPYHNGLGLGGEPEHYKRFDGIEPQEEHEATQLQEMESYRLRRKQLGEDIEMSGHDAVFFREWFTRRAVELGHEVLHVEGVNDHYQQLAMLARDRKVDFVLSTYPDFYVFDMGNTGYTNFHQPYPLGHVGRNQFSLIFRATEVARELGVPLAGLRELSCLLGNHLLRPCADEPLARFLDSVRREQGLDKLGVVRLFVQEVRARWSNGARYNFTDQVNYLHQTTGLDMKVLSNALDFYCIDRKHPNNVWSATFPLLKPMRLHQAHIEHQKFLDVVQFKETRLRAQYGDAFIRRHSVLTPLRAFKYGLLMMSAKDCCGNPESLDEDATEVCVSNKHFVTEHRVDYASRLRHGDLVDEFEVAAQLPKFDFLNSDGPQAPNVADLFAGPLCEAFADLASIEYEKRQEFYLTLFSANTNWIRVLPPKLIPVAAALRFLAKHDILGMDKAIESFVEHLAVLQHGAREAFLYNSRRFNQRRKSGGIPQDPDERSYGLFYVIVHTLYKSMVELNELCGWAYADVPPFETVFDYNVYQAIRSNGIQLSKEELALDQSLRRAVFDGISEKHKVDLGPHDSIWIPEDVPHDQRPRAQSVPVIGNNKVTPVKVRSNRSNSSAFADNMVLHKSPDYMHRWSMMGHAREMRDISISPAKRPQHAQQHQPVHTPQGGPRNNNVDDQGSSPSQGAPRRMFGSDSREVVRGNGGGNQKVVSPADCRNADPTHGGWWRGGGAQGRDRGKSDGDRFTPATRLEQHYGHREPSSPQRRPTVHVAARAPPQGGFAGPPPGLPPPRLSVDESTQGDDGVADRSCSPTEAPTGRKSLVMLTFGATDDEGRDREGSFSASITDGCKPTGRDRRDPLSSSLPTSELEKSIPKSQHDRSVSSASFLQHQMSELRISPSKKEPKSPPRFSQAHRHSLSRFGGLAQHAKQGGDSPKKAQAVE